MRSFATIAALVGTAYSSIQAPDSYPADQQHTSVPPPAGQVQVVDSSSPAPPPASNVYIPSVYPGLDRVAHWAVPSTSTNGQLPPITNGRPLPLNNGQLPPLNAALQDRRDQSDDGKDAIYHPSDSDAVGASPADPSMQVSAQPVGSTLAHSPDYAPTPAQVTTLSPALPVPASNRPARVGIYHSGNLTNPVVTGVVPNATSTHPPAFTGAASHMAGSVLLAVVGVAAAFL